jgi:hypothetical protein
MSEKLSGLKESQESQESKESKDCDFRAIIE